MTWPWRDALTYGPGWAACALIVLGPILDRLHLRRTRRRYEERWGVPYDGP